MWQYLYIATEMCSQCHALATYLWHPAGPNHVQLDQTAKRSPFLSMKNMERQARQKPNRRFRSRVLDSRSQVLDTHSQVLDSRSQVLDSRSQFLDSRCRFPDRR